jgi:uncharacterized coiled-coil DUF342 family protein
MSLPRSLFSFSQSPQKPGINPKSRLVLDFSPNPEEKKNTPNEYKAKLDKKLGKYRKKYKDTKKLYFIEYNKFEELNKELSHTSLEIQKLESQVSEYKEKNKNFNIKNIEDEKILKNLYQKDDLIPTSEPEKEFLDKPSLSSLQLQNLIDKLNAKNKRVAELQEELTKENNHAQDLMKQIANLKETLIKHKN